MNGERSLYSQLEPLYRKRGYKYDPKILQSYIVDMNNHTDQGMPL
jgi:hypothetical protein